jgi:hypothetical protein
MGEELILTGWLTSEGGRQSHETLGSHELVAGRCSSGSAFSLP